MKEKSHLSNLYQHLFYEVSFKDDQLSMFENEQALHLSEINEELFALKEELRLQFWILAERVCTKSQFLILRGIAEGKTQKEMSEELGCNQSSIHKSIKGNVDYTNNIKHCYGGTHKKLKRHIALSPIFINLFQKIADLDN